MDSLVTWTKIVYALHAFSLLTGIVGTATVVGAFFTGWPFDHCAHSELHQAERSPRGLAGIAFSLADFNGCDLDCYGYPSAEPSSSLPF